MAQNSSRKKAPARKSSLMGLLLGGRKATGAEAKAREEKARRTSKARNSAKRQLDYIGYDAMYKNGIAQVEEGLFSQTVEFSDISYQSARRDAQENIFSVLSSL